jgi:phytoene synthase
MQPLLQILLELETEIRGVLKPGMEHRVAHVRMEWWRAEVERFASGKPAHPLTRALLETSPHSPNSNLSGLVDTAIWDLASATFGSRAEVSGYCERWSTSMIEPVAHQFSAGARTLGAAIREIELLCDLASDAHAGRLRFPLDELERDGIDPESLAKPPWPAKLCTLLRARHRELRSALAANVASVRREHQPAMRGLLVWSALANRRSLLAERALPQPMHLPRFALLQEVWVAWRTARRASRGTFEMTQESTL